jgi:hypothetical protein
MSNAPLPSDPAAVEPATGESVPLAARRSHDAELVLAAVNRMDAVIDRERVKLDRLQSGLHALAQTIAQAKIAMQADMVKPPAAGTAGFDVAALLNELEHRVDAMLEIGGRSTREDAAAKDQSPAAPPTPNQATEAPPNESLKAARRADPDRVPTVSGVVSRLGRPGEEPLENAGPPPAEVSRKEVATLEAMVQALSALDTDNHRQAAPGATPSKPAPQPKKPVMPENELLARPAPASGPATRDGGGTAAAPQPPPEATAPKASEPAQLDQRPDPLATLKAMSAAERIALFS